MIQVVCAIIERGDRVLAACRGPEMRHPWKWEFPGGKVNEGESKEDALHRELMEELMTRAEILEALPPVEHEYEEGKIQLWPFRCVWTGGEPLPSEHAETVWIEPGDMLALDFAAADVKVAEQYLRSHHRSGSAF
ncbi:MAG: (deoxy)nucleoside triphosphate pyrophosphohydrolase [Bacteroidia bacterium]|nr:(deoxy)nucleoside triphosphate pyrophosphohydrolase [Bacteroidia bacterium]